MHILNAMVLVASSAAAAVIPHSDMSSLADLQARTFEPPACVAEQQYQVNSKSAPQLGDKSTLGSVTCSGTGSDNTCSLSHSNTYSVSVGYSVGGSLSVNLEKIFSVAGFDGSYTYSTTKGTVDGGTVTCPKGAWTCSVKIVPYVSKVAGSTWIYENASCGGAPGKQKEETFQAQFPQLNADGQPVVDINVCTCPNLPNAKDKGAPPLCPIDC